MSSSSQSHPVQVRPHPTKGRALHATKPFLPNQIILTFAPLLLLPTLSHLATICSYCLQPTSPRACSRCHAVYYCNATCQGAAWKAVHSRECKALKQGVKDEQRRRELPTLLRALMQALLCTEIEDGLKDLEGHVLERRAENGGDKWRDLEMMAMAACAFSGRGTAEGEVRRAVDLLCKIQNNSFQRFDPELGSIGLFLEPTLAMANHSCVPNVMVQFVGRKAFLMAENPVQAGDEIEIAYTFSTDPLLKRQETLSHFMFVCECPRCKDNLNIYQVCATSPNIPLNSHSLVADLETFQSHPAVTSQSKQSVAKIHGKSAHGLSDAVEAVGSRSERWQILRRQYREHEGLVGEDLWAITPIPDILFSIAMSYGKDRNFAFAVAVTCFVATNCDAYQYASPFIPTRLTRLLTIVKFLANTAPDTASMSNSLKTASKTTSLEQKAQDTLQEIDQVSLCQMLLLMILHWAPEKHGRGLALVIQARELLDDIEKLVGREKELSLIEEWRRQPDSDSSRAFFKYAVVQQVSSLASLGRAILKRDFED